VAAHIQVARDLGIPGAKDAVRLQSTLPVPIALNGVLPVVMPTVEFNDQKVGWVERSETHQATLAAMGFAVRSDKGPIRQLYPSYDRFRGSGRPGTKTIGWAKPRFCRAHHLLRRQRCGDREGRRAALCPSYQLLS